MENTIQDEVVAAYCEGKDVETLMRIFQLSYAEIEAIILSY